MGLARRLISGDPLRRTRLHDEKGNLAAAGELARLPLVAMELVAGRFLGHYPETPLIARGATAALESVLGSHGGTVVEFGSGRSTLWFARRARHVTSFETDRGWFERIDAIRRERRIGNLTLTMWDARTFPEALPFPDAPVLFFIDGAARDVCVECVRARARPKDTICLDNTDKDSAPGAKDGEMRRAEQDLLDFARVDGRPMRYFTGFAPAHLYAEQTLIVYPKPAAGARS